MVISGDIPIALGTRIENNDQYGTVKYIGNVSGTNGEWLGIEWDDPTRGKHNGTHNGEVYFSTSHPTSGSFIRPTKANFGVSFSEAFKERYGLVEEESAGIDEDEMFINDMKIEVVGAQKINRKQSQFNQLREISVRRELVCGEFLNKDIGLSIPHVRVLDLSVNLFSSWEHVATITQHLKSLKVLNVGYNKLQLSADPATFRNCFSNVETLHVTKLDYDWEQVLTCCQMFPQLRELHVCFNQISAISKTTSDLENLTLLSLEGNKIGSWKDVLHLGKLKSLHTLILNSTGIEEMLFDDVPHSQKTLFFPSLQSLYCHCNQIKTWESIDELNKLQKLDTLYMRENPLTQCSNNADVATVRSHIIARISNLRSLNRTEIHAVERKGSELDYLKAYGKAWRDAGGHQDPTRNQPSAEFVRSNPRYMDLVEKYGPIDDAELVQTTTALKNFLITVHLCLSSEPDKPIISKKLPVSMTVLKLKALAQRLLKLQQDVKKISYISSQMEGYRIEMDCDTKDIGFYSIEEGDRVIIQCE